MIFLVIWNTLIALITTILFFIILIDRFITQPVWSTDDNNSILNPYITICLIILLYIDIIIQFNITFNERGHIIKNRKKLAFNYLKTFFGIDFITTSCILLDVIIYNKEYNYFTLIFYIRIINLWIYNNNMLKIL